MTATVLYLRFDGVLHPADMYWDPSQVARLHEEAMSEGHRLIQNANLLDEMLAPYPHADVVLSTTWALNLGHAIAAKRLPRGLRERVIGGTYQLHVNEPEIGEMARGSLVLANVAHRQPKTSLAVDDDEEGWDSALGSHVVLCDKMHDIADGLARQRLERLLKVFR